MKIGTDIIQIDRIEKSINKFGDRFLQRYLNENEIKLIKSPQSAAGFWAAKEAISKALGCGIGKDLSFHDIIISKSPKGAPYFQIKNHKNFDIDSSSLSISHDCGFAIAVVAISTKDNR
jgi:holo-[acyl-carrier protein] synthase